MRRLALLCAGVLTVMVLGPIACRDLHGLTLVVRAADRHGAARWLADLASVPIGERLVSIPVRGASMRARVYAPRGTPRQTVLLVSGLHPSGVDEPRLVALARRLAEANVTVVTPEIPELSQFEITPRLTDRIEDAALWLATRSGLAPSGRVGLMGVSFSGGLAVVAAGRSSLRDHLIDVFSFGGHDDLRRVLDYFCAGNECAGTAPTLLAWPFGIYDDELIDMAREAGYVARFTIERRLVSFGDPVMALSRILMTDGLTGRQFASVLPQELR